MFNISSFYKCTVVEHVTLYGIVIYFQRLHQCSFIGMVVISSLSRSVILFHLKAKSVRSRDRISSLMVIV